MNAAYYATVAGTLGANVAQFNACVSSDKYTSKVDAEAAEAMQNGAQGTPWTVLYAKGDQAAVSGALPYATFVSVIKAFADRQ